MPRTRDAAASDETQVESVPPLKPKLVSIEAGRQYMGGISRAKFYEDVLPVVDIVKIGSRTFIVIESMDRLIEAKRSLGLPKRCVARGY